MRRTKLVAALLVFFAITTVSAEAPSSQLSSLRFLLGRWESVGGGKPGEAAGGFTFTAELQNQVIVRRNYADIPASSGRPASRHEDLMVIFAAKPTGLKVDYYDSEGHVIRYDGEIRGGDEVVFVSEASGGAPRFRLSYKLAADSALSGKFEIAPAGKPTDFGPYLSWSAHRVAKAAPGQ